MDEFHILVIRLSSMGDVLMPSGLLAQMKKDYGDRLRITFLTSEEFRYLVDDVSFIDNVVTFRRKAESLSSLIVRLVKLHQERPFNFILDLHATMRSFLLRMRFCMIPRLVVDKRSLERSIFTKLKINFLKNTDGRPSNQLERLIHDFKSYLGLDYDRVELAKYINESTGYANGLELSNSSFSFKELKLDEKWSKSIGESKIISFFPSASFKHKRWPVEYFKKLISELLNESKFDDYKFTILAGPKDEFCKEFDELAKKHEGRVLNLYGQTNLEQSAAFTKRSELCVGNDTGLLHISESVGTPVIMIYGPTTEYFGFSPHLSKSKYYAKKMWCRPCSTTGSKKCFRSQPFCLTEITPEQIKQGVVEVLSQGA